MSEAEELRGVIHRITPKIVTRVPTPEDLEAAERDRVARDRATMVGIGIPPRFFGATFDTSVSVSSLARTRAFMDTDFLLGRCLVLAGPPGVGKTWSSVAALNAARSAGRCFRYFGDVVAALFDSGPAWRELRDLLQRVQFLVIDDLGVEEDRTGRVMTFLDGLFYHREAWSLPTIITTNLLPDDFAARLGRRIVDRIQGGWGELYRVPGESLRGCSPETLMIAPPVRDHGQP
jgi:DNA replication protein DnaC